MDKGHWGAFAVGEEQTQVTAEWEFTPEASGTIELTYTLDASGLAGTSVVVFETLYLGDGEVASHADIEDENQTVTFEEGPHFGTTATVDGQHTAGPQEKSPSWTWWVPA